METFIKRFVGICVISYILFFVLAEMFKGGSYAETEILSLGVVLILLLSYLIALVKELIDLHKGKEHEREEES